MFYRDSSVATHTAKGYIAGVESSHAVRIEGGSTGGIVEPVGDDANISLNVRPKGSGSLIFGLAGGGQTYIQSSQTVIGNGSTSSLLKVERYRIDWTIGALSSAGTAGASIDSTVTVAGVTTNSIFIIQALRALNSTESTGLYLFAKCSTADELRVTTLNTGPSTLSGSTASAHVLQFKF